MSDSSLSLWISEVKSIHDINIKFLHTGSITPGRDSMKSFSLLPQFLNNHRAYSVSKDDYEDLGEHPVSILDSHSVLPGEGDGKSTTFEIRQERPDGEQSWRLHALSVSGSGPHL